MSENRFDPRTPPEAAGEWRTASRCAPDGDCVEIRLTALTGADVRDSKNRAHGALSFRPAAWAGFVGGLTER